MINFEIFIEFETSQTITLLIPGPNYLEAILNFYKYSEDLQPIKSFTLLNN